MDGRAGGWVEWIYLDVDAGLWVGEGMRMKSEVSRDTSREKRH